MLACAASGIVKLGHVVTYSHDWSCAYAACCLKHHVGGHGEGCNFSQSHLWDSCSVPYLCSTIESDFCFDSCFYHLVPRVRLFHPLVSLLEVVGQMQNQLRSFGQGVWYCVEP
jgi:hypothetical protein